MRGSLGLLIARNWPIKLAAVFFAIMLYIYVAAQRPVTARRTVQLAVTIPPGRSLRQQPPELTVVIAGKLAEMLKLRSFPSVVRKTLPDTFSASEWRLHVQPSDVDLPKGSDVQVTEITPQDIDVLLDSVGRKDVKIIPLVRVEAESGYVLRGLSIVPSVAHLVGPEQRLVGLDSVSTVPLSISGVGGSFVRTVPVDTSALGVVRITPKEVRVAGEVTAIVERSIDEVPIAAAASGFAGFQLAQERVSVSVRGPESKVNTLTRDSLRVVAHLVGKASANGYARLTVSAPPGIVARARPDSVTLRRRSGRG